MRRRPPRSRAVLTLASIAGLGLLAAPAAGAQETADVTELCVSTSFSNSRLIRPGNFYSGVSSISLPAGPIVISSASARDGYPDRVNVVQTSERYEIEFVDALDDVLATSKPTEDVPDLLAEASWTGPLGTVDLPEGVVGIRAHFRPDLPDDGSPNSVHATEVTICWNQIVDSPPVIDQPETTEPSTSEAIPPSGPTITFDSESNAIDVTTTIRPIVESATTVAQDPKGPSTLPVTGTTTSSTVFAAMSLVAAGGALLLASRSRLS